MKMNKFDETYEKIIKEGVISNTIAGGLAGAYGFGKLGSQLLNKLGTPGKIIGALTGGTIGAIIGVPLGLIVGIYDALKTYLTMVKDAKEEQEIVDTLNKLKEVIDKQQAEKSKVNESIYKKHKQNNVIKEQTDADAADDEAEISMQDMVKAVLLLQAFKQFAIEKNEREEEDMIDNLLNDLKEAVKDK